ncbi:MAG: RiPP maturation radical SAM C-methyltransferase [Deltaproteobacteria bacterium]|nr:RiPP maturation radical SAM C-methyltransferase [Deltaproteobacteria bacterium]
MTSKGSSPYRVALISMPWSIFNRPSIQLGTLKAFLEREMVCRVDTFHPYLNLAETLGVETYRRISRNSWAGEALFSPLLFPEQEEKARELFNSVLSKKEAPHPDFSSTVSLIKETFSEWIDTVPFSSYDLIGFSICFNQLLPSLYMAEQIKKITEEIPVVFGGSSCTGSIGRSLLHHFPQIDYVVDGEGEQALLSLCMSLENHPVKPSPQATLINAAEAVRKSDELIDINDLPYPDYRPYFKEMRRTFSQSPIIPTLPLEFSRGCWWNRCSFCNLNLQWKKYRMKTADRMVNETDHLMEQYKCINFTFTDNALPLKEADKYFKTIGSKQIDLNYFAEIRAIRQPQRLKQYRQGGLATVQVGIEALSTSLLQKMAKGTTVIDNIAVMKLCAENGIQIEGNLITGFPTTTEQEIEETLFNLDFVLPYNPLSAAAFFLGYGSPVHDNYGKYGIQAILVHHKTKKLFPARYHKSLRQLTNGYRGDRTRQQKLWKPVYQKIEQWQNFHKERTGRGKAALQYRDGGSFIIIRQERPTGMPLQHRLNGLSRRIYLFCCTPREIEDILSNFNGLGEDSLTTFVKELCQKRLMFRENDRVISLAVHQIR